MLLVAAGGVLQRELGVDDRAVKALATDLHSDDRQAELAHASGRARPARPRPAGRA